MNFATLLEEGERLGFPRASMDKLSPDRRSRFRWPGDHAAGRREDGLGTDLLGALHVHQSQEFILRSRVLPAIDILRSACVINAELLGQSRWLGCMREGAAADLLLVDGNPLEDIAVLADRERLSLIMKGGQIHKGPLS
ncbi:MAG: amidohydrolase family protein [Bryobacteraceae bacterium]